LDRFGTARLKMIAAPYDNEHCPQHAHEELSAGLNAHLDRGHASDELDNAAASFVSPQYY
jgi:hypothetical protein